MKPRAHVFSHGGTSARCVSCGARVSDESPCPFEPSPHMTRVLRLASGSGELSREDGEWIVAFAELLYRMTAKVIFDLRDIADENPLDWRSRVGNAIEDLSDGMGNGSE